MAQSQNGGEVSFRQSYYADANTQGAPSSIDSDVALTLSYTMFICTKPVRICVHRTFDVSYVEKMPMVDIIYCSESYN